MLAKPIAFEQDKNAIFLRNQEMHLHFSKLETINNRKNCYLPILSTKNKSLKMFSSSSTPHMNYKNKEQLYSIQKNNMIIYNKIDKITKRNNHFNDDSKIINGYLNIKKNSIERIRAIKKKLIKKENTILQDRLKNIKPVIDNIKYKEEFYTSQKISEHLRKIKSSNSVNNIYLSKNESHQIREYEKGKLENTNNGENKKTSKPKKIDKKILAKVKYTGRGF